MATATGGWPPTPYGGGVLQRSKLFQRKTAKIVEFALPLQNPGKPLRSQMKIFYSKSTISQIYAINFWPLENRLETSQKIPRDKLKNKVFHKFEFDLRPFWGSYRAYGWYELFYVSEESTLEESTMVEPYLRFTFNIINTSYMGGLRHPKGQRLSGVAMGCRRRVKKA